MRLTMMLAAASLLAAGAAAAQPATEGQFSPPDAAHYVYLESGKTDTGAMTAFYVALPDQASASGQHTVWVLQVFRTPVQTEAGPGTYSATAETYDCDKGAVRRVKGGMFSAQGALLDSFSEDKPLAPIKAGSFGADVRETVCQPTYVALVKLQGLKAILLDASVRPE